MKHIKIYEEFSDPKSQLSEFNSNEDRVKSAFMSKQLKMSWKKRLEEKYPLLKITFFEDGDTRKAQANIK